MTETAAAGGSAADGTGVGSSAAGGSVNFDRAAGYYDRTRGDPPDTVAAQTQLLAAELAGAGPVLEIGVGTGRIAVPLAGAGVTIAGLDLSAEMLAVLAAKTPSVPAVRGSALELPLADQSVAAVIACHVLHLIPDWRAVVGEALRVLRPGGLFLTARGSRADGLGADLRRRFRQAAGLQARGAPGQGSPGQGSPGQGSPGRDDAGQDDAGQDGAGQDGAGQDGAGQGSPHGSAGLDRMDGLDELMAAHGVTARHLAEITSSMQLTAAELLDQVAANLYSWTWPVEPERRLAAVAEVRAWVAGTMGDPATVLLPADRIRWHSYRIP